MALTNEFLNAMLAFLNTGTVYMSLHTGDPGTTGANEVTGTPYARLQVTFGTPASGAVANTNNPEFSVPDSTAVTHIGLWSALTDGDFYIGEDSADHTLSTGDLYRLTSWTITVTEGS